MTISTTPVLMELAEQRATEQAEAEAWKVAQLAVGILGNRMALDDRQENMWNRLAVAQAREILAESRRAVSSSTTEDSRG